MKEYICIDDAYKSLDKDERKVFLKLISNSMRYTKADILKDFYKWLQNEKVGFDMDKSQILVVRSGRWTDAIKTYLKEMESE